MGDMKRDENKDEDMAETEEAQDSRLQNKPQKSQNPP